MLEFVFVLMPMLGFIFLTIDIGWAIYCRSTLQYAARQGCRYAITSQTQNGLGQSDSIRTVTQQAAMGFLGWSSSAAGWNLIQVNFYAPGDLSTPLAAPTTSNPTPINQYPNIVEVVVANYQFTPFMPIYKSKAAINFVARSADRMEAAPNGVVPPL
jgi:Flp pilus assembly protein TadG